MRQYLDIKENYKDCILFFRLGDFYEMFYDDALTASRELELTLTGKNCGLDERAPMCGVPFHSAESYIARLVEKGYKVAICEQTEDPAKAKGIVSREVIKIVTPGTITSGSMLREDENNYLASVFAEKGGIAMSYCDISTGELTVTESDDNIKGAGEIINELARISAREIIYNDEAENFFSPDDISAAVPAYIHSLPESHYSLKGATENIRSQLGSSAVITMGLTGRDRAVRALGGLLAYLLDTQKQSLSQITGGTFYEMGRHMALDKATLRNLEITETLYEKRTTGSLLGVLDKTGTAMGSRTMKKWLREPLNASEDINRRLDAVEALSDNPLSCNNVREHLKNVYDMERLAGRMASGSANGKDMIALRNSLRVLPEIKLELTDLDSALLSDIEKEIHDLDGICRLIDESICEDAPFVVREGGLIRDGYSEKLDDLKLSIKDGKEWIATLESRERERTGIKNLKVGYNKVFGYYIDVTRANSDMVPDDYIRKQTLVNNERYITPELKEMESLVLGAEAKINQLEYELFTEIREEIMKYTRELQETAAALAALDVLCSFAEVSGRNGYVKPVIDDSLELVIEKGRHPVIEQMSGSSVFVPNDVYLNSSDSSMMIITGPNMAGKSTYMRQTALIVLMAQAGCFVPADYAKIGVVDRIFTRIGASDNLSQGQSTFFVEMSELAYILNCAGSRSLIILDEIGRGTSTYDGLSIAWATVEHLCGENKKIRTLFATHYHELTALEGKVDGVKNLNVDVSEENGDIVFLHKIVPGPASRSYGIHVAKLAGVPGSLLKSAEDKLSYLESEGGSSALSEGTPSPETSGGQSDAGDGEEQLSFFTSAAGDALARRVRDLDLMEVTPSQAIGILEELKEIVK